MIWGDNKKVTASEPWNLGQSQIQAFDSAAGNGDRNETLLDDLIGPDARFNHDFLVDGGPGVCCWW
jgi:hypothetical protein